MIEPMDSSTSPHSHPARSTSRGPEITGTVEIRRIGRFRFPVLAVVQGDRVLAELGHAGWLRIFVGRGRRIVTAGGRRWRLVSLPSASALCPAVLDEDRLKLVLAMPGEANYGINGKEYAYALHPVDPPRWVRPDAWVLWEHEDEIATFHRRARRVEAIRPVPLAAVLVAFTVIDYGIPGEGGLGVPRFSW